mgnify:CR=1 FL=1|tara:strand:- start:60 stop:482 length:423 start_codon:yes stop_codon:yes gene_type:complete
MPKKNQKKTSSQFVEKRNLIYKDDMQEYGLMLKALGDRRISVQLVDKTEIMAIIPGRFRKRCWFKAGDVIIVARRDFQQDKFDVVYKYNEEETKQLIKTFEIPEFFKDSTLQQETVFEFEEEKIKLDDTNKEEDIDFDDI